MREREREGEKTFIGNSMLQISLEKPILVKRICGETSDGRPSETLIKLEKSLLKGRAIKMEPIASPTEEKISPY